MSIYHDPWMQQLLSRKYLRSYEWYWFRQAMTNIHSSCPDPHIQRIQFRDVQWSREMWEYLTWETSISFDILHASLIAFATLEQYKKCRAEINNNVGLLLMCQHGRLDILRYSHPRLRYQSDKIRTETETEMCLTAIRYGQLNIVKFLYEEIHVPWPTTTLLVASQIGNLAMIKYLLENGITWEPNGIVVFELARFGQIHILEWCMINGYPLSYEMIRKGATRCTFFNMDEWITTHCGGDMTTL
jgi:hypothetical protein